MPWEVPFVSSLDNDVSNKPDSISVYDEIIFFVPKIYSSFVLFLNNCFLAF